jgi:hypothetical protein
VIFVLKALINLHKIDTQDGAQAPKQRSKPSGNASEIAITATIERGEQSPGDLLAPFNFQKGLAVPFQRSAS